MEDSAIVVGLTGQTGAGKSLVSKLLVNRGFRVIDADIVARQVVARGTQCLIELVLAFGIEILEADGTLNRRRLGSMVFADKAKRAELNRITFPYIQEELLEQIKKMKKEDASPIFLDAPTLFESGSDAFCDKVVSVVAPEAVRLARIMARDHLDEEEARARMNAQHEDEYYTSRSDFVIHNDADLSALRVRVLEMLENVCGIHRPPDEAHNARQ